MGRSWGREEVACLIPPHPSRESCLINWAMQTHNYITFLNNRHFLPEVLLSFFFFFLFPLSQSAARKQPGEIKAADNALSWGGGTPPPPLPPPNPLFTPHHPHPPPPVSFCFTFFFFTFSRECGSGQPEKLQPAQLTSKPPAVL